jgi:hypothetical protein
MDDIESRLTDWGDWAGGRSSGGGSSSPLARMIAQGSVRIGGEDHSEMPAEIEEIERAVAQLRLYSRYLKRLVFFRYLYHKTPEEIASYLDRNKADIQAGLDRARDWIGEYLDSFQTEKKRAK